MENEKENKKIEFPFVRKVEIIYISHKGTNTRVVSYNGREVYRDKMESCISDGLCENSLLDDVEKFVDGQRISKPATTYEEYLKRAYELQIELIRDKKECTMMVNTHALQGFFTATLLSDGGKISQHAMIRDDGDLLSKYNESEMVDLERAYRSIPFPVCAENDKDTIER